MFVSGEKFLETVIVVGAGASADYGYPIGDGLKTEVADFLQKSSIDWIRNISERIRALGSKSLDKYLMETGHPENELTEIKRAIGLILFEREVDARKNNKLNPPDGNDWITTLARDVWDNRDKFRDGQKVKVITFNYDRLFEWKLYNYAYNRLNPSERSNHSIFTEFINKYFEIHHVYGRLPAFNEYETPFLLEGDRSEAGLIPFALSKRPQYDDGVIENIGDDYRRVLGRYCSRSLVTMYENPSAGQTSVEQERRKYQTIFSQAERVVILGFGFDDHNLRILGFPYLQGTNKDQFEIEARVRIIGSAYSNAEPLERSLNALNGRNPRAKKVDFVVGPIRSFYDSEGLLITRSQLVKIERASKEEAEEALEYATMGGTEDCCARNMEAQVTKPGYWKLHCDCGSTSVCQAKVVAGSVTVLGIAYLE